MGCPDTGDDGAAHGAAALRQSMDRLKAYECVRAFVPG
jgi:hypothetical protein